MKTPTKDQLLENFWYRIGLQHPLANIHQGAGNPDGRIVIIQPRAEMPDRDAITGALKNFGILDDAYRATSMIVDYDSNCPINQNEVNRYYLKEMIELINPLMIITCGPQVTSLLRKKRIESFKIYSGKKIKVDDMTAFTICAVTDPYDYGYARASVALKAQGKSEWTYISKVYQQLVKKEEKERWL